MWRLIIYLIILILSVWIGLEVVKHPGYLLIMYQPWMVQMPLWLAAFATFIFFILFYFLITSVDQLHLLWYRFQNWLRFRREQVSYTKTQQGLAALIEHHFLNAERLFVSGINQTVEPLVNYLGAAKAAHAALEYEKRDQYIQKAYQIAPHANMAIGLVQAEFALDQDKLEQATATLNHLRQLQPKHPRVLQLLEKTYVRLSDWKNLLTLLPYLYKTKVINKEQFELFEKNIYCELLRTNHIKDRYTLDTLWYDIPRATKKNPDVATAYIKQLLRFPNTVKEAEEVIRKVLKTNYSPELVKIYGCLSFEPSDGSALRELNRQLSIAGSWLKTYGDQPDILLLLGKLCVRAKLWGKAKDYFVKCLTLGPNVEASLEYGKLLENLGENEAALQQYRESLTQEVSAFK